MIPRVPWHHFCFFSWKWSQYCWWLPPLAPSLSLAARSNLTALLWTDNAAFYLPICISGKWLLMPQTSASSDNPRESNANEMQHGMPGQLWCLRECFEQHGYRKCQFCWVMEGKKTSLSGILYLCVRSIFMVVAKDRIARVHLTNQYAGSRLQNYIQDYWFH